MFALVAQAPRGMREDDRTALTVMTIISVVAGLLGLVCAILNIVAGIRNLNFRSRTLGLVALFSNIPGLVVIHCWYFTVGMAIYGLIVYFDRNVVRAFEMAAEGVPPEEILETFSTRRRFRRRRQDDDDYDRQDERPLRSVEDSREDPDENNRFRSR